MQSLLESQHGKEIVPFSKLSEMSLGLIKTPVQWAEGALAPEAKRPKCDADHSSPCSASLRMRAALLVLPIVPQGFGRDKLTEIEICRLLLPCCFTWV